MSVLSSLEPQEVFSFFDVLCTIPRGSGNEKQIAEWVVSFAQERGLEAVKDDLHCVLVRKPGQLGLENAAPLILHGHLDMVCEKEEGSTHNFETDSLRLLIDGDSITAEGTSLGADNGIGVSYILALLDSKEIPHPPIEAVLTAMEEKGKYGASQFDTSQLKGRRMIDFNWITDTEILAGCSGDVTFTIDLPGNFEPVPAELSATRLVKVRGLVGGHCEFDIQLERANAILILARLLNSVSSRYDVRVSNPYGGAQNNAIPIDAEAVLSLRPEDVAGVEQIISDLGRALAVEYIRADPNIRLEIDEASAPSQAFSKAATARFGQLTSLIPNGVISWSLQVPGIVETSNNLGTIRPTEDGARLMSTITSALTSRKHEVLDRIRALVALGGSDVTIEQFGLDAPEFPYQPDSALLAVAVKTYQEVIGTVPDIHVSQCSLELGMFSQKVPGLETISIGTELHDLHSPNESVNYKSVAKTWPLVRELVSRLS
jgi:dipeptidase D